MNGLAPGFVIIFAVLASAIGGGFRQLFNGEAFVFVVGGSLGVLITMTGWKELLALKDTLLELARSNDTESTKMSEAILRFSRNRGSGAAESNPLLRASIELSDQGLDPETYRLMLGQKLSEIVNALDRPSNILRNLAKYPPALGMTGTVVGMIHLFSNLGGTGRTAVGPSLALALTATFYGLILANFLLLPLADRLQEFQEKKVQQFELAYQMLLLIEQGQPNSVIQEGLRELAS